MKKNRLPRVNILMATFNGSKYLQEQIDSILQQTYHNWQLIINDDGSIDETLSIIKKYIDKYQEKIFFLENNDKKSGVINNFNSLLSSSTENYFMFSDQDDIWLKNKIELTLNKMRILEARFGSDIPILIHTDMKVVDENLNTLSDSFWRYQQLKPEKGLRLNRLLVQNITSGNTVMINKSLRDMAIPIPDDAVMHDWWLGLVAVVFGKIGYINIPTVLYRQHSINVVGAKEWNTRFILRSIMSLNQKKKALYDTIKQARCFLTRYYDILSEDSLKVLKAYSSLDRIGFFQKRLTIFKYCFFKIGLLRNIGMLIKL